MRITFYCFNIVHILFLFIASHRIDSTRLDFCAPSSVPITSPFSCFFFIGSRSMPYYRCCSCSCTCHVLFPGFGKRAIYFSVICHLMDILSCRLQMIHGNGWNSCHLGRNWLKLYCILIEIDMKEIISGKKRKRTTENVQQRWSQWNAMDWEQNHNSCVCKHKHAFM